VMNSLNMVLSPAHPLRYVKQVMTQILEQPKVDQLPLGYVPN
jgi:hypothetical protein